MKAFKSFLAHLLFCAIVAAIALLIALIPGTWPYVIGPSTAICLGILSKWYTVNFEASCTAIILYLLAILIAVISFIVATLDWIFGWGVISTPWVYVVATEGLPIAFILLFFMCINLDD